MSATNKTTYYELPFFIGTDTPSWLGDWNTAMSAIDTAINKVNTTASAAQSTADSAKSASDSNTEAIAATNTELKTIKTAVQNYDAILNFTQKDVVVAPNNVVPGSYAMLVQNTNKTLGKLSIYFFITDLSNPTTYQCTTASGSTTWLDLATVEDNCFNLNQSSLPNTSPTATSTMTLGIVQYLHGTTAGDSMPLYLLAWFDGATTHIGCTSSNITSFANNTIGGTLPIFLSGSVYNPVDPNPNQ